MEQLINKVVKASWPVKIGAVVLIAAVVTGLNWYLVIDGLQAQIVRAENQRKKLEGDYIDKKQIADNLNEYRREKEQLEAQLQAALLELPNDAAIDEFLRQVNDVATRAGLQISLVEPQKETKAGFYARIPIAMKVTGSFHELALFFDSVGKLKRIVNVEDIKLATLDKKNEKVMLVGHFNTTTFRFLSDAELAEAAAAAGARRR